MSYLNMDGDDGYETLDFVTVIGSGTPDNVGSPFDITFPAGLFIYTVNSGALNEFTPLQSPDRLSTPDISAVVNSFGSPVGGVFHHFSIFTDLRTAALGGLFGTTSWCWSDIVGCESGRSLILESFDVTPASIVPLPAALVPFVTGLALLQLGVRKIRIKKFLGQAPNTN